MRDVGTSEPLTPVPAQTACVAHAAFPKGNPYLTLRDTLGTIFQDDSFADLDAHDGQPGVAPGGSRSSPSCSFAKPLPTAKRPRPSAHVSTGISLGLQLMDPALTFPC